MKRSAAEAILPTIDEDSSFDCDDPVEDPLELNEPSSSTAEVTYQDIKRRKKLTYKRRKLTINKETLPLDCRWKNCSFSNNDIMSFVDHVTTHIKELPLVPAEVEEEGYVYQCLWGQCTYTMSGSTEARLHIAYHGYYKQLTSYGAALLAQENFPQCNRDSTFKDCIPEEIVQKEKLQCFWDSCEEVFLNPCRFFLHVKCHANNATGGKKSLICQWKYCKKICGKKSAMLNHMQSHTLEKDVACPICEYSYASYTKFHDHCVRQIKDKTHQCAQCKKLFSSERILRDHMRIHLNLYKCPFCDYSSSTPSSMGLHIRLKHLPDKNFLCPICPYEGKQKKALVNHMYVHYSSAMFDCSAEECQFSCRTKKALKKHEFSKHGIGNLKIFACHLCDKQCFEGRLLAAHLVKAHGFPPSTKLDFIAGDDGILSLDPSQRSANEPPPEIQPEEPLFVAYDHVDEEGNVTSKVLVGAQIVNQLPQVLTLPQVEEGGSEPELQSLKAVPITSDYPPMFVMQSSIDAFKATNANMTSFKIVTHAEQQAEGQFILH